MYSFFLLHLVVIFWRFIPAIICLSFCRKLGEGAFGTVYGGEAYINKTWTGVAVKTLKVGSNSEDKVRVQSDSHLSLEFSFYPPCEYIQMYGWLTHSTAALCVVTDVWTDHTSLDLCMCILRIQFYHLLCCFVYSWTFFEKQTLWKGLTIRI